MKNPAAVALGKLGKGKKKTITRALRKGRSQAAKIRWAKWRLKKSSK
jgi:hypothetical protein